MMTKYQATLLTLMIFALALATAIGFAFGAKSTEAHDAASAHADNIVLFNGLSVNGTDKFTDLHVDIEGIDHIFLNGELVWDKTAPKCWHIEYATDNDTWLEPYAKWEYAELDNAAPPTTDNFTVSLEPIAPCQIFPDMATYLALVDNYTPTVGFSTSMDWQTSCEDYCLHAEDYAASRGWEWRPHVLSPGDYKYLYGKDITIPHMAMMAIIDNAIYVTDLPSKRTVSFFGLTLDK